MINAKRFLSQGKTYGSLLCFFGMILIFVGGSFHSDSRIEKNAQYAADVAIHNTRKTHDQELLSITVSKTSDSGSLADDSFEFLNLYGVFRQQKITFASAVNPSKEERDIILNDKNYNAITENLSVFYAGAAGSIYVDNYKTYKHSLYPLQLMFEISPDYEKKSQNHYFVFISQTHADKLLESENKYLKNEDGKFSEDAYKSLLYEEFPLCIDGKFDNGGTDSSLKKNNVVVLNIYYETNYYYEGLHEVMGDFIVSSYDFPLDLMRTERKNMYFMSEYTYQNRYFMNHINDSYSSGKYRVELNSFNLVKNVDDVDYLLSFYYSKQNSNLDALSVTLFSASFIFLILSLFMYFNRLSQNKHVVLSLIILIVALISPYFLFLILYAITGNILFFPFISTTINLIYSLLYIIIILFALFYNKRNKSVFGELSNLRDYYEINV